MTRITTLLVACALTVLSSCGPQRFVKELDPANYIPRSSAYRTAVHADSETHDFPVVTYGNMYVHRAWISHDGNVTRKDVRNNIQDANLTVYFDPADPQLDAGLVFTEGTTFPDGRPAESVQVTGVSTDIFRESNNQVREYFGNVGHRWFPRASERLWFEASRIAIDERDNGVIEARGGWDHAQARISWNGEAAQIDPHAYGTFNYSPDKGFGQARVRAMVPFSDWHACSGDECTPAFYGVGVRRADTVDFYVGGES